MASDQPRPPRSGLLLGATFLALLALGSGLAWMLSRQGLRSPVRVLLVTPPGPAGSELDGSMARALGALIQDHLEFAGGFAVTTITDLPEQLAEIRDAPRSLVVELQPRRVGQNLDLSFRSLQGRGLTGSGPLTWRLHSLAPAPPPEAFRTFLRSFPKPILPPEPQLVPRSPGHFWDLVQASAWRLQNRRLPEAMRRVEAVVQAEPDSAAAQALLGNLRYRDLLNHPAADRRDQVEAEACFRRALSLAPGHPRATLLLSLMKSDSGNQREALEMLLESRKHQPHNPTLLTGIAYAARGAGLLPLARRAMDLRDRLAFTSVLPQAVDITCLYTGELDRFEASLRDQPGHLRSASGVLGFYRGYLALVKGDRIRAHAEFRAAAELESGYPNIRRLSSIFALILHGRHEEAWKQLREYDQERIGMREPDGEFTIRLAEAYALMGDRASAMEMAGRAFARGFGCTAWYERSPMLEPLRGLPKWQALMQHIHERQTLMEDRFPVSLLEEN